MKRKYVKVAGYVLRVTGGVWLFYGAVLCGILPWIDGMWTWSRFGWHLVRGIAIGVPLIALGIWLADKTRKVG